MNLIVVIILTALALVAVILYFSYNNREVALCKAAEACTKYAYTAKLDFKKYYDSISHNVLKQLLNRKFKDPVLLRIFDTIIGSYAASEGCGLPIGNLTSQYFANAYLSPLDHYAKERLFVPVYIRYMDDILLASNSKEDLKTMVSRLEHKAKTHLN